MNNYRKTHSALIAILVTITWVLCLNFASAQTRSTNNPKQRVILEAKLSQNGPVLTKGVEWRVFNTVQTLGNDLVELAYAFGGATTIEIPPGEYLIHAAYGHAGVVRKISVSDESLREEFTLNAGGLKLLATATGNAPLPRRMLRFDIYEARVNEDGNRKLLAKDIKANEVIAFPVGTYHVISYFGRLNAEVRADLRVEPGKLTEASLEHRAALVRFRLVRVEGGDAIPDTAWSILTETGEIIRESERTFPSLALAEGNYTAIAKNNDNVYSEDFEVKSGFNQTIEVRAIN